MLPRSIPISQPLYSVAWPAALALAQRALAEAARLALVAALTLRFFLTGFSFFAALPPRPLTLAQRARWAAPMAALAEADIFRRRRLGAASASAAGASSPAIEASC